MSDKSALTRQWNLLDRWLPTLQALPVVDLIWLEGSLAADRANPSSDIDIRFAIADAAYVQLWETDRTPLLAGLGEHLILEKGFTRALTATGLIVEAWAYRTSEVDNLELFEWRILFNRLPAGQPKFRPLPERSMAETWPEREPLTPEVVWRITNLCLVVMTSTSSAFHTGEQMSCAFSLDFMRNELIKIMYRRIGVYYCKRAKHFSQVFPSEWLSDLARTYVLPGRNPLDPAAIAAATVELFAVIGKHLQALSDQAGGGFEPAWYARLNQQLAAELRQFQH